MTWLRENVTADGRGHHHRHLAAAPPGRGVRHRRGHRVPDDAARPGRRRVVGRRRARRSASTRGRCRASPTAPGSSGRRTAFGTGRCPSPGSPWTSRPRCTRTAASPPGDAKCTYGTGAFLLVTTGETAARSSARPVRVGRLAAGRRLPTYCLDGQVYTAGSALRWLAEVGVLPAPADLDRVAGTVPDSGGVTFVPALAGLGAPQWAPHARGQLSGLQPVHHARAHRAGRRRGDRRLRRAAGRGGRRRPRRAAHRAARRRRADPVAGAAAGPGRPAPAAGAGQPHPRRDRARGRRARAPRPRRGRRLRPSRPRPS